MVDVCVSAALATLTIIMAYLGVHVTLHPAGESKRHICLYKAAFSGCALLAVVLVVTQGIRTMRSQRSSANEISGLKGTLGSVRTDLTNVETATSLLRSEQTTEIARRQQAETDLALIVLGSGKAVREGVVSDIKKLPINGQMASQPLVIEELKLFSEVENSTHADAPYGIKVTLQATAQIDPLRIAIRCASEIKYVERRYPKGLGDGEVWYGAVEVYKNDHTIVIVNMTGNGKAAIRPDLPLILHIESAEPIIVKSFERGSR